MMRKKLVSNKVIDLQLYSQKTNASDANVMDDGSYQL